MSSIDPYNRKEDTLCGKSTLVVPSQQGSARACFQAENKRNERRYDWIYELTLTNVSYSCMLPLTADSTFMNLGNKNGTTLVNFAQWGHEREIWNGYYHLFSTLPLLTVNWKDLRATTQTFLKKRTLGTQQWDSITQLAKLLINESYCYW